MSAADDFDDLEPLLEQERKRKEAEEALKRMEAEVDRQERAHLTVRNFPTPLRETIDEVARGRGMKPDDWIIEQCLAALGFIGYNPCPLWKPMKKGQ